MFYEHLNSIRCIERDKDEKWEIIVISEWRDKKGNRKKMMSANFCGVFKSQNLYVNNSFKYSLD